VGGRPDDRAHRAVVELHGDLSVCACNDMTLDLVAGYRRDGADDGLRSDLALPNWLPTAPPATPPATADP
jgi:hypothetical protein